MARHAVGEKLSTVGEGVEYFRNGSRPYYGMDRFRFLEVLQSSFQLQLDTLNRSQSDLEQWIVQNCKELREQPTSPIVHSSNGPASASIVAHSSGPSPTSQNSSVATTKSDEVSDTILRNTPISSHGIGAMCCQHNPGRSFAEESSLSRKHLGLEEHIAEEKKEIEQKKVEVHAAFAKMEEGLGSSFRKILDKRLGKSFVLMRVEKWEKFSICSSGITHIATRISQNYIFSSSITFAILLNAVFMAVDTNNYMDRSYTRWQSQLNSTIPVDLEAQPLYLFYVDLTFAIFFAIEICVRMIAEQGAFFLGEDKSWNALDMIVVVVAWVEVITFSTTSEPALRLVLLSLLNSLVPLTWCFVTLFMIQFIFAIFFMQVVGGVLDEFYTEAETSASYHWVTDLHMRMGTFWDTIVILLSVITGGEDWTLIHKMFVEASLPLAWVWVLYIVLMVLGVLNVIAAVFVEGAMGEARRDRQLALVDAREEDKKMAEALIKEFEKIDTDNSGEITLTEWNIFCGTDAGQDFLKICNFGVGMNQEDIFRILDLDDSEQVVIAEFVTGLMAIHGAVNKIDVQTVINNNKKLIKKCYEYMEALTIGHERIKDILVDGNTKLTLGLERLHEFVFQSLEVQHRTSRSLDNHGFSSNTLIAPTVSSV